MGAHAHEMFAVLSDRRVRHTARASVHLQRQPICPCAQGHQLQVVGSAAPPRVSAATASQVAEFGAEPDELVMVKSAAAAESAA